jgi:hypothetical protein
MDPNLAINSTNKCIRFVPNTGAIDCISTDAGFLLELIISGPLRFPNYTTNGAVTTTGGIGTITVVSDKRLKKDIEYEGLLDWLND